MEIELTCLRRLSHPTVKAVASILVGGELAIHDIKVLQLSSELIVAMPNKEDRNGVYRNMVHPINRELRDKIEQLILDEYRRNDK